MSFYVVLPSNSCPKTRPDNKAGKFIVDYENSIHFDGNWEVALADFTFSYKPSTLTNGMKIKYHKIKNVTIKNFYEVENHRGNCVVSKMEHDHGVKPVFIKFPNISILDNKLVISHNNDVELNLWDAVAAKHLGFTDTKVKGNHINGEVQIIAEKELDPSDYSYLVELEFKTVLVEELQFEIVGNHYFPNVDKLCEYLKSIWSDICVNISLENDMFNIQFISDIVQVEFDPSLAKTLGLDKIIFGRNEIKAVSHPRLYTGISNLYIYTSISEPLLVGDVRVPLLKSIWLDHTKFKIEDVINVSPKIPMYLPVASSSINKIEINIRDDSGNIIDFGLGSKTSLTLHFRKNDRP